VAAVRRYKDEIGGLEDVDELAGMVDARLTPSRMTAEP